MTINHLKKRSQKKEKKKTICRRWAYQENFYGNLMKDFESIERKRQCTGTTGGWL